MKFEVNLLLCIMFEFACSQFVSRRLSQTPCEVHGTALVEQFFNVVFAEFQHSPPTCACVQMCPDQFTYCYPNGCFKKTERRKNSSPVSTIHHDAKTTFLVNGDNEIFGDLIGNDELMASSTSGKSEKIHQRPTETHFTSLSYPLKEIVFKYKRIPKLQMKYNLREQVKHIRDKKMEVDLSKTRWPTNKQINRPVNHKKTSNYMASIFPQTNQAEASKYFKRYLTKRENQMGLDISALYLYKDVSNFSLESLIDNLMEKSFEDGNGTLELKISNLSKLQDEDNIEEVNIVNSDIKDLDNDTDGLAMKTSIITNATDNSDNKQKYYYNSDNENSTTATYFEMITTLSKEIEKQNNKSIQAVGYLTGHRIISENSNNFNDTKSNIKKNSLNSANVPSEVTVNQSTTEAVSTSTHKIFIPDINSQIKKGTQRIVRKLRNRKLH